MFLSSLSRHLRLMQSFINKHNDKQQTAVGDLGSSLWWIWLYFLQIIYQTLPHFNLLLVYIVYQHVITLFTKIMLCFFKIKSFILKSHQASLTHLFLWQFGMMRINHLKDEWTELIHRSIYNTQHQHECSKRSSPTLDQALTEITPYSTQSIEKC